MVKSLPRVLYHGVKILVNSVKKSIQEEIEMSRQLARIRYQEKEAEKERKGMSLEEAQQILDLPSLDPQLMEKRYKHLLSVNKNFKYLKSKVVKAREVIEKELQKVKNNSTKYMERGVQYLFFTYVLFNENNPNKIVIE